MTGSFCAKSRHVKMMPAISEKIPDFMEKQLNIHGDQESNPIENIYLYVLEIKMLSHG